MRFAERALQPSAFALAKLACPAPNTSGIKLPTSVPNIDCCTLKELQRKTKEIKGGTQKFDGRMHFFLHNRMQQINTIYEWALLDGLEMGQAGAVPEQDWTGSFRAAVRLVSFICNGSFGWLKSFLSSWCPESSHPIQTYPNRLGSSIKHHLAYVSRRAFYLQRNNPTGTHHLYTMDYGIWVQYPWHQVSTPTCYVYNLHIQIYIYKNI